MEGIVLKNRFTYDAESGFVYDRKNEEHLDTISDVYVSMSEEIDAINSGRVAGGKARWKRTRKKTRSAAASKAAKARWAKSENDQVQELSGGK